MNITSFIFLSMTRFDQRNKAILYTQSQRRDAKMSGENSRISTKEAAKEVGVTPRTLQNYITSGKLSAVRDGSGNYQIDKAEFYRIFPGAQKEKRQEKIKGNSHEVLEAENKHLKEMVDFLNKRLESSEAKEVAAITERASLLATITSAQKLLEHQASKSTRKKFLGIF